jgi:alkyl sulfatase BDS1-like metallo-beta-lactamase superfamily hydrolase
MTVGSHSAPATVSRIVALLVAGLALAGCGQHAPTDGKSSPAASSADANAALLAPKPASAATIAANRKVRESLPFSDQQDFEDAKRGLIDAPATLTIKNDKGEVVWDFESYKQPFARIQLGEVTLEKAVEAGDVKVDGNEQAIRDFFGMLDASASGSTS